MEPETTAGINTSPGSNGDGVPDAKLETPPSVEVLTELSPAAAPEPATEGDTVGLEPGSEPGAAPDSPIDGETIGPAPGEEPTPGAEPGPGGRPEAGADVPVEQY